MKILIKRTRRAAAIGLYGTLLVVGLTVAAYYLDRNLWRYTIVTNDYTHHLLVVTGLVLAVVVIAAALYTTRRQLPRLRQMDALEEKLRAYASLVRTQSLATLFVTVLLAAVIVITHDNVLIMLQLLLFLTLALSYPNMYKMKADLGLLDDEMQQLFGDQYLDAHHED